MTERGPSAAAKAWYVNKIQEPLLAAGIVAPVVSSEHAVKRMMDFDAGAAERERVCVYKWDADEDAWEPGCDAPIKAYIPFGEGYADELWPFCQHCGGKIVVKEER